MRCSHLQSSHNIAHQKDCCTPHPHPRARAEQAHPSLTTPGPRDPSAPETAEPLHSFGWGRVAPHAHPRGSHRCQTALAPSFPAIAPCPHPTPHLVCVHPAAKACDCPSASSRSIAGTDQGWARQSIEAQPQPTQAPSTVQLSYLQLFLDFITETLQLPYIAFVDDVAIILHSSQVHSITSQAAAFLTSMGLVLRCKKSELLPARPMEPIPDPQVVEYVMPLGHPLPTNLKECTSCSLLLDELRRTLTLFHDVPLPSLPRVRLVNIVILPAILDRSECLWITHPKQKEVYNLLLSFCLAVVGLPPHMSPQNNPWPASIWVRFALFPPTVLQTST
jgi:hypothetical protein